MNEKKVSRSALSRLRRKLRGSGGYTLAEGLVALVIFLLVSGGMVDGVRFASEQYRKSMELSEARVLCSTLTNVIRGELSNTDVDKIEFEGGQLRFISTHYTVAGDESTPNKPVSFLIASEDGTLIDPAKGGELWLGTVRADGTVSGSRLLSSGSYSSYRLRVALPQISYSDGAFDVTLTINREDGTELFTNSFAVFPLTPASAAP